MPNNQKTYSNIVSDIDGTLISSFERQISQRLKHAVASVVKHGCTFSIATGRTLKSALKVHETLGANGTLICYQGAMAVDPITRKIMRHERLPKDTAAQAIDYFTRLKLSTRVYLDDEIWVANADTEQQEYAARNDAKLVQTKDLMPLAERKPTVVLGIDHSDEMTNHVSDISNLLGDSALVTRSLPHFCEVGSPKAGKEKALQWLAEKDRTTPENYITFGDGPGDNEMLRWAGLGIAVETGNPETISIADQIIPGPDNDGVPAKIETLIATGSLAPNA